MAGFKNLISVDIDATLQSSYKLNFPTSNPIIADVSKYKTWSRNLNSNNIDLIIGGPPCQGFSRIGKGDTEDPRRNLLLSFFNVITQLKPSFFVMENVEGLLDNKNKGMLDIGLKKVKKEYSVLEPFVLDASTIGAPTKRKRVFVIGCRKDIGLNFSSTDFMPPPPYNIITVKDAIYDLGTPLTQENFNEFSFSNYKAVKPSKYSMIMRKAPPKGLGSELAENANKRNQVSSHIGTNHTLKVQHRFEATEPGKTEKISHFPKLEWQGLCPTLRAGTGKDKGGFQSARPIHPEEPRVITPREAARLQGFPDWFLFHPTKWHSFRMIGNSVSPIASHHILSKIYEYCADLDDNSPENLIA
ncbi:DNA cytosine methyltransferase [Alcanivorax sp.]|uniref:DNA cytosine methyltransferase n=1 Tax=Alcanivorax sp. TaxID=1872427 RepID=UPI0039E6F155